MMPESSAKQVQKELRSQKDSKRAEAIAGFFKTKKGQYGEGDIFLGLMVPQVRAIVKGHTTLALEEIDQLLASKFHEERLAGLMILVHQSLKPNDLTRKQLYDYYLSRTDRINNWDLVDCSARAVVGAWLRAKNDLRPLRKLAKSDSLWERRIAIVATHDFILAGHVAPTFEIAKLLLGDDHDLIHKSTGWMLREAGKKDAQRLVAFLRENHDALPRTALRYAIERFPAERRAEMLKGKYPKG